jgi:C-terminal peptidase prc
MIGRWIITTCLLVCLQIGQQQTARLYAESIGSPGQRVMQVLNKIQSAHINPPTLQQMLLSGVQAIDVAPGRRGPEISKLCNEVAMTDYLDGLFGQQDAEILKLKESAFIQAVLEVLPGDTDIVKADKANVERQLAANRYVGIGIVLALTDGAPTIMEVIANGTADRAGLRKFDVIQEIEGVSTINQPLEKVVDKLRGEEGSQVNLLIKSPNSEARKIVCERTVTFIPTIVGDRKIAANQWEYFVQDHPLIAYLKILRIGPSTVHELKQIEAQLRDKQVEGLVLDCRMAVGQIHDAVLLADQFLEEGTIGHVQRADDLVTYAAQPGSIFKKTKIAVLISESSDAATAMLSAALQDHSRALVVGMPIEREIYWSNYVELPNGDQLLLAQGSLQRGNGIALRGAPMRLHDHAMLDVPEKSSKKDQLNYLCPDFFPFSDRGWGGDVIMATAVSVLSNQIAPPKEAADQ